MNKRRCILCNEPAAEGDQGFTMTPEAEALIRQQQAAGADPSELLAQSALCARCAALSPGARAELARDAIKREMESFEMDVRRERMSKRVDIAATIASVTLSDEAWEWLNLIGYVIAITQDHARVQDDNAEWFATYEDYKWILVNEIAKDSNTLSAIFMAIRCEWTHQAAALLRTLCESLITLRYIAQDKAARSKQFIGYAAVEEFKMVESLLRWEARGAKPEHVAKLEAFKTASAERYAVARTAYTYSKNGKKRAFRNWCNKTISEMAKETDSQRLYGLVYSQTSAYVHGSAWSLRAVGAFSRRGYDARRAMVDTSTLVKTTLAVWFEWAAFCDQELGWALRTHLAEIKERLDQLQAALDTASLE